MNVIAPIDDQPISATFFGEGKWLSDFITPNALEIQNLYRYITEGTVDFQDKITALWQWVAKNIKYKRYIRGKLWIDGKTSTQNDLWNSPSITARVGVGNCANKSFLLASLLRNELPESKIYAVLGNLYNGKPGGHAWVQVNIKGVDYIVESTTPHVPIVPATAADRYETVHLFNDQESYAIEGRTVLTPFTACYSTWLKNYLDWAYVHGRK